jgi:nucleotide-binding universal stress UspA family protein
MGSVAEKVAHHSIVPVLILREGGSAPAGLHLDVTQPMRVLVPLDGSAHAKTALAPAAALIAGLSAPAQGALHMVRVIKPLKPLPLKPLLTPEEEEERLNQRNQMLHKARTYLESTSEHLKEGLVSPGVVEHNPTITWSVSIDQDVASAIIRVAENGEDAEGAGVFGGCDVIAMATHGRGAFQRWAVGSVTERVLNATRLPILVVRPAEIDMIQHTREIDMTVIPLF